MVGTISVVAITEVGTILTEDADTVKKILDYLMVILNLVFVTRKKGKTALMCSHTYVDVFIWGSLTLLYEAL